jgi:hypothetical protein
MQVRTYCNSEFVRANCVWTKVKERLYLLRHIREGGRDASLQLGRRFVLSPSRSLCSQAVRIKACSERKPRSLAAERTRPRTSLLRNGRFRSIRCFFISGPPRLPGGAFVPQIARIPPPTKDAEQLDVSPKSQRTSPHSLMFQYPENPTTILAPSHNSRSLLYLVVSNRPGGSDLSAPVRSGFCPKFSATPSTSPHPQIHLPATTLNAICIHQP